MFEDFHCLKPGNCREPPLALLNKITFNRINALWLKRDYEFPYIATARNCLNALFSSVMSVVSNVRAF